MKIKTSLKKTKIRIALKGTTKLTRKKKEKKKKLKPETSCHRIVHTGILYISWNPWSIRPSPFQFTPENFHLKTFPPPFFF